MEKDGSERETRGKLGVQERKRPGEDLDDMARLRYELGVMKRQMRDKDVMVETLSARVGSLVDHIEDMRRESSERQTSTENTLKTVKGLLRQIAARGV
jgi:chromosome segregation ATPase